MARPKEFDPAEALATVMDQFRRGGFDATSLSDITARTGVRKASLYATYGDKRKLFLSALECYRHQSVELVAAVLADSKNLKESLRALTLSFVPTAEGRESERLCLCVNTAIELGTRDSEVAACLTLHARLIEAQFADAIRAGQKRGDVNPSIDPNITARGVLVVLYGAIVAGRGCFKRREVVEVVDAYLAVLDVPKPRAKATTVRAVRTVRTRGTPARKTRSK